MGAPAGIAKFDSASIMSMALARFLDGRDFSGVGQSPLMQAVIRQADWLPRHLRERVFAVMGAREGVPADEIEKIDTTEIARWITNLYPKRRYPAVMIGSSNGALMHMDAALGIPWLPQTILSLVDQRHVHPDDPVHAMETEQETARRFLSANPYSQLHHMHDPSQDRLMLGLITYYRSKFLRMPPAYREFIEGSLEPNGTIYIVECNERWPTKQLDDRYFYQFGAVGGPTTEEYFEGGERVEEYLERYDSPVRRWKPPTPDTDSPEAEWGFEPALRDDILEFARERGYRVVRVQYDDAKDPSSLVADFHRAWYHERQFPSNRLVIESFGVADPYWVLRTGSVPLWITFNKRPSLEFAQQYLDGSDPYDQIFLTLFAHGVDSVGLPPIEEWRSLVERARDNGDFLGLTPDSYPAHFSHFARYSQAMRKKIPARYPLPGPLPIERFERFTEAHGQTHGVRLEHA